MPNLITIPHHLRLKASEELISGVLRNNLDMIEEAISDGAYRDHRDEHGYTALFIAIQVSKKGDERYVKMVEKLVSYSTVNLTYQSRNWTALHEAVEKHNVPIVNLLIAKEANVSASDTHGLTPLLIATSTHIYTFCDDNYRSTIKALLKAGAKVNVTDNNGKTPLHNAVHEGDEEIITLLLDVGADFRAMDKHKTTILHEAAVQCYLDTLKKLFSLGLDVNATDVCGRTPLHIAVNSLRLEKIKLFLEAGANINAVDNNGETPLFKIKSDYTFGCKTRIKLLVESGASVNAIDKEGHSALYHAIKENDCSKVRALIEYGSIISYEDKELYNSLIPQMRRREDLEDYASRQIGLIFDEAEKTDKITDGIVSSFTNAMEAETSAYTGLESAQINRILYRLPSLLENIKLPAKLLYQIFNGAITGVKADISIIDYIKDLKLPEKLQEAFQKSILTTYHSTFNKLVELEGLNMSEIHEASPPEVAAGAGAELTTTIIRDYNGVEEGVAAIGTTPESTSEV